MPRKAGLLILSVFSFVSLFGCIFSDTLASDGSSTADIVTGRAPADDTGEPASANSTLELSDQNSTDFSARLQENFPGCGEPADVQALKFRILEMVNAERAAVGLDSVRWNTTLEQQATEYACEMIHYDFFDHVNPVTKTTLGLRADEFNYDFQVIGENLAAGQRTPEKAMQDWMNSPGHRQNILDARFVEMGVGVRVGGDYGMYWVQEFGLPAK